MRFWPALPALLAAISLVSGATAQDTGKDFYDTLLQADAIDRTFDPWMQAALSALLREAEIDERVTVNGPPQLKSLNVLIVDRKKLAAARTDDAILKRLLPKVANNVLAIPPGTIVFDKTVVATLLMNAHNDGLGSSTALDAVTRLGPRASPEAIQAVAETNGALANYLRYGNIRNDRENFAPDDTAIALGPMTIRVMMQELQRLQAADPNLLPMYTMMLAPIVLHEIGHLRRGSTGAYEQMLPGPLGAATLSLMRQEENAADDYAVERMRRVIRKRVAYWRGSVQGLALELGPAIATIKYMRDQVLEDTFNGFRGLNPEDLLVGVEHWDCNVRKGVEGLRFDNGDKVRAAWFERFPLLTRAEFDEAQSKVLRRVANGTHSHHFTRGDRFLAAIEHEASLGPYSALSESLAFLAAVIRNEPMGLYSDVGTLSTGLSLDELHKGLSVEVLPAVTCPDGMCTVGRFRNYAGFTEAVGPLHNLRRARITFPLFGPSSVRPDKDSEEYLMYAILTVRTLANVMGDKTIGTTKTTAQFLQTPAAQLSLRMRKMSLQCGVGFVGLAVGKRHISIRTLNPKNWVTIDVEPLPPRAPQLGAPKGKRR